MPIVRNRIDIAWVSGQLALFVVVGWLIATTGSPPSTVLFLSGTVLALGGLVLAMVAVSRLGPSVSPFPTPVASAELMTTGPYALVRHPMYGGVILLGVGLSVAAGSIIAVLVSLMLVPFFSTKASHEERLLVERFPAYARYMQRVPHRLLPWLI